MTISNHDLALSQRRQEVADTIDSLYLSQTISCHCAGRVPVAEVMAVHTPYPPSWAT